MRYSAIITAYKEEKTVGKVIEEFLKQLPKNSEIILVAPDEDTLNVGRKFSLIDKRVRIIKDSGKGKPNALNLAFKNAKGDILVLTDGDVVIGKNSIKPLLSHFRNSKVGAVSGRVVYLIKKDSLFYEWAKLSEKVFDSLRKKQDREGRLFHPTGYLYAIRNGLVREIYPNCLSDDALIGFLIKSKGYLIKYEPKAKVYVKFPLTFKDFIKQKSRTRAGFLQIKKIFGKNVRSISSEISLGFKDLIRIYGFSKIHKMFLVGLLYLISWLRAYWLIYKQKPFEKIWERIESTK
ncbi:MAG: glycosyltransferase [Candidatus Aenigmatarchaeota archaeon]